MANTSNASMRKLHTVGNDELRAAVIKGFASVTPQILWRISKDLVMHSALC
jgi:hypothetical protein